MSAKRILLSTIYALYNSSYDVRKKEKRIKSSIILMCKHDVIDAIRESTG